MRLWLAAIVLALAPTLAQAQGVGSWQPLGCAPLPSMASAVFLNTIAGGIPNGATLVDIQVTTQNVNYRDDGVAPTATTGLTIFAGSPWLPYYGALQNLQLIQVAATATGYVCFYH
jgi:hypothetical protein